MSAAAKKRALKALDQYEEKRLEIEKKIRAAYNDAREEVSNLLDEWADLVDETDEQIASFEESMGYGEGEADPSARFDDGFADTLRSAETLDETLMALIGEEKDPFPQQYERTHDSDVEAINDLEPSE